MRKIRSSPNNEQIRPLILINRLFEWSQNFITRDLTELYEQGVPIFIGTRKIIDRNDLNAREKKLLERVILQPENPFLPAPLFRHINMALRRPGNYFKAWKTLFLLKHKPSKFFRSVVCLFRAAAMTEEVLAKKINLLHAHFITAPGDTAVFLSKMAGIPFGATVHAMDIYVDNSGLKGKIAEAAYINACTQANKDYLESSGIAEPGKTHIIYYGVEVLPEVPPAPVRPAFRFIAVGRLVPKKGFGCLIEACGILKRRGLRFQCNIIGKGPLEAELSAKIEALGVSDCVSLLGFVAPNDMAEAYRNSDVAVVPSIVAKDGDREGLPNVCLEAMNNGLPVIGSDNTGIPEGVIHGENGWLVPGEDSERLAEAMFEAATCEDLERMRVAARRMVGERFSLAKNIGVLRGIMEKNRRASFN